jgi:hypothetical protein
MESISFIPQRIKNNYVDVPHCPEYGNFRASQEKNSDYRA